LIVITINCVNPLDIKKIEPIHRLDGSPKASPIDPDRL